MTRSGRIVSALVLGLAGAAGPGAGLQAQAPVAPARPAARAPAPQPEGAGRQRDELIRTTLGLTDEQAARVLPLVDQIERGRQETMGRRLDLLRDLRSAIDSNAADPETLKRIAELDGLDEERSVRERTLLQKVDGELSVRQRAQLRLLISRRPGEMPGRPGMAGPGRGRPAPAQPPVPSPGKPASP